MALPGNLLASSVDPYFPVLLFKRSIKLDPEAFPTLKDDKYQDNWHRTVCAMAKSQDIHQVLDYKYKPSTVEDNDLLSI